MTQPMIQVHQTLTEDMLTIFERWGFSVHNVSMAVREDPLYRCLLYFMMQWTSGWAVLLPSATVKTEQLLTTVIYDCLRADFIKTKVLRIPCQRFLTAPVQYDRLSEILEDYLYSIQGCKVVIFDSISSGINAKVQEAFLKGCLSEAQQHRVSVIFTSLASVETLQQDLPELVTTYLNRMFIPVQEEK